MPPSASDYISSHGHLLSRQAFAEITSRALSPSPLSTRPPRDSSSAVPGGGGSWFGFGSSGAVSGAISSAVSGVGEGGGGSSSSSSPGAVPGGKQRPADEAQPMTDEQEEVD